MKKTFGIILFYIVSFLCICICVSEYKNVQNLRSDVINLQGVYNSNKNNIKQRTQVIHKKKYVVTNSGTISQQAQYLSNLLDKRLKNILTYTSGNDYAKNRAEAKQFITAKNFFTDVMPADSDSTGHSLINSENIKSKVANVISYRIDDDYHYTVFIDYINYHDEDDLDDEDELTHSYLGLQVVLDRNSVISAVTPLKGLTPVYS